MAQNTDESGTRSLARPIAIIVVIAALVALVVWQFGPTAYSTTNPYVEDLNQDPTGAGSNPDGAASVLEENFPVEREADAVIDGSADATDATGITDPVPDNTVADEGRRTLDPDAVVSPEEGTVSNETGTVQAPEVTE